MSAEIGQKGPLLLQKHPVVTSVCLLQNWCAYLQKTGNWKIHKLFSSMILTAFPVISGFTFKKHATFTCRFWSKLTLSSLGFLGSCPHPSHHKGQCRRDFAPSRDLAPRGEIPSDLALLGILPPLNFRDLAPPPLNFREFALLRFQTSYYWVQK